MPEGKIREMGLLKQMVKGLYVNNCFIALAASAWYLSGAVLLESEVALVQVPMVLFVFFGTLSMYNIDRLFGDEWEQVVEVIENKSIKQVLFAKRHAKVRVQLLLAMPPFLLLFFIPFSFLPWLVLPFIIGGLYAVPMWKNGLRIRELPYFKVFLIAFVWAWVGSCLSGSGSASQACMLFVQRFLLIYAITIPFDLRDMSADKAKKIKTIPIALGGRLAWASAILALVGSGVLLMVQGHSLTTWRGVPLVVALGLIGAWRPSRTWAYYLAGLDGVILLDSALVLSWHYLSP
ncbi:MAG: UbiA family prenyltransferase [Bacteroidetes bacterium]|jgi:4-hydroxybenzoate polyprenyltransferase|nr:UbiA family prenyltransferase [Bacteroidota bacterium]